MADEQDKWLDRETAELLLRREPLDPVDPSTRERAERLAAALRALAAPPPPPTGELPGEAAALAAFRAARAARADGSADAANASGARSGTAPADPATGGRTRHRVRPLRLALAAVLAAGMVGGVAVAAGTGALPTPFGGGAPDPAASVPAAATPDRPASPSARDRAWGEPRPDGTPTGPAGPGAAREDADTGGERDAARGEAREQESGEVRRESGGGEKGGASGSGDARAGTGGGERSDLARSCRDLRAGEALGAAGRRALEDAAGGAARVPAYCAAVLAGSGGRDHSAAGKGEDGAGPGDGRGSAGGRNGDGGTSGGRSGAGVKRDGDAARAERVPRPSAAALTRPVRGATVAARPAYAPRP
ncbi:hypothetical protein ACFY4K_01905 [Streptomyces leeuwenhoekii]|uniref:hypothetical protein n=1 Tax=Streptomyces leeuwenhoekii TaxID=1437453 RepID=UPI0036C36AFA